MGFKAQLATTRGGERMTLHPLWSPSPEQIPKTHLYKFLNKCALKYRFPPSFQGLYDWSITDIASFWSEVWDFCGIIGHKGEIVLKTDAVFRHNRFFPQARLNFAENLLVGKEDAIAITYWCQDRLKQHISWNELKAMVASLSQFLKEAGIQPGDTVACITTNSPTTVAFMLAAASIGAVFSTCSPDLALGGLLDRLGQINPKIIMVTDAYWHKKKLCDIRNTVCQLLENLPSITGILQMPLPDHPFSPLPQAVSTQALFENHKPQELRFVSLPFSHPLYIVYSSGTTGPPKCIMHSAGGTLIQHKKEHQLHCDIHPGDRVFYCTNIAWMMWHWQVSALASGATIALYDGTPWAPQDILFRYVHQEQVTHMGGCSEVSQWL